MIFGHVIDALLGIGLGSYCLLLAFGKISVSRDPEESARWREKYKTRMEFCGSIILLSGLISAALAIF